MTTATITDLELLKTRVSGAVGRQMPEHIARLGWDAGRLAAWQRDRLRALLGRAIAGSPFHAGRLRGVDPDRFELADLARLPVMTKADMMEDFDTATTDRRLTRDLVERHLARSVTDPSLLLGDYVVLVSTCSPPPRAWSATASRAARCSPSPATPASPSAPMTRAVPSPTAWPRPRCWSPTCST
jgi:hypothetical protein